MKLALLYEHAFLDGGYPRDVRWLAGALSRAGVKVSIFGRVTASPKTDGLDTAIDLSSWQSLPLHLKRFDLVHIFGLFSMNHPLLAGACATRGMPLVISPLSHLLPLPMQMKRRKKALFLKMAWGPWIRRMTFHVFSRVEAKSVLNWVPDARLFEASMGIFPAADQSIPHPSSPESGNQPRSFLFFGRNDIYQKGLDILLEGYARALTLLGSRAAASVKLTIAGHAWNSSTSFLSQSLSALGIEHAVTVLGAVDEPTKSRLLAETDYLVYLSRWDGPPRPIRAAIAAGTPVIVTPETNMGDLVETFGAGLQIGLEPQQVAEGLLRTVLDKNLLERNRLGVEQLRRHLAWDRVSEDYVKGYEHVLCGGTEPNSAPARFRRPRLPFEQAGR